MPGSRPLDSQQVELVGTALLTSMLLLDGIEVADPKRDRGIDLIAYLDRDVFVSAPIQVKASFDARFGIDRKYEVIPGLRLVHVWHVRQDLAPRAFCMSYDEAVGVAERLGWTETNSWMRGGYSSVVNPNSKGGRRILDQLKPFEATADSWKKLLFRSGL
jgi:hypothetical protein